MSRQVTSVLCRRCTRSWARVWGGTALSEEYILPVYCAGGVQGAEPGCGAGQPWVREPVQRLRERSSVWAGLRACGNLRSTCSAPQFLLEGASHGVFWPFLLSMMKNQNFTIFLKSQTGLERPWFHWLAYTESKHNQIFMWGFFLLYAKWSQFSAKTSQFLIRK